MIKDYWWELKGDARAREITGIISQIDNEQSYKRDANLKHMRMYANIPILGLNTTNYARVSNAALPSERYTFNLVRSTIDTLTNKIAKNKIKVTFLTDAGQSSAQRKSKQLTKYTAGMFVRTKARDHLIDAFKDALIFGNGFIKVHQKDDKVICERVFPDYVKWDDRDAENENPTSMFEVRIFKRDVAKRLFPKFASDIDNAPSAFDKSNNYSMAVADSIYLYEAWHLPSEKGAKDGVHSICIENAELFHEKWERDSFPYVHLMYCKNLVGYGGSSMTGQLVSTQIELNKTMHKIQLALHLCSPKLIVKSGSNIVKSKLNNEVGGIVEVGGAGEFQYVAPTPIDQTFFVHKQQLIQEGYEQVGVSMMSSQSKKPEGLDSGKALREFNDIESERFMILGQMWEDSHIKLTEAFITEQKAIAARGVDAFEKVDAGSFIETIRWSEVDMDRDAFVIKAFPTSYLSSTPAGRLNDVKDMMGIGLIDQEWATKLLDFPDLEGYMKYKNSDISFVEYLIERVTDFGEYIAPDPKMPLPLAIQMFQSAYLQGRIQGMDQEKLDMIQLFMVSANAIITEQQMKLQQAMAQQMPAQPTDPTMTAPQPPQMPNPGGA
jgi:hypothetical protein